MIYTRFYGCNYVFLIRNIFLIKLKIYARLSCRIIYSQLSLKSYFFCNCIWDKFLISDISSSNHSKKILNYILHIRIYKKTIIKIWFLEHIITQTFRKHKCFAFLLARPVLAANQSSVHVFSKTLLGISGCSRHLAGFPIWQHIINLSQTLISWSADSASNKPWPTT